MPQHAVQHRNRGGPSGFQLQVVDRSLAAVPAGGEPLPSHPPPSMPSHDPLPRAEFVAALTAAQWRLYGFIRAMTSDRNATDEVLQETNLALWEQADRFVPGTNFPAWACKVAWFKVLDHRKAGRRQRVRFSDQLVEQLAAEAFDDGDVFEHERKALAACIDGLPARHRAVLAMHYENGLSLADIGTKLDRNRNAVAQLLHRIRGTLRACIERRLAQTTP
jgi:RNA polymerase sigma-70 factor (ECF subfamily)